MADTKTASVQKPAVEKVEESTATTNEQVSQTIRLIRFKLSGLQADARRRKPFMSGSQEEAAAKVKAAITALEDFANYLDKQPSH